MNIDLIPNGAIKRVHVSQNDVGRTLTFELFNNSTSYTVPSGATVKIQGTKPSGFGFSEVCTVSGNVATIDTTEAMTDESGNIQTELSISYGDVVIGTSNFVLAVEKNPHPDTTTDGSMETIIPELTLLVNEVKGYAEEIEGTYHAYGSPWVASTVAQMTDTDKIYVYVGSESGYTNGNWYYYNGTAWVSGGVYNSVAVQTDTTLSVSGMPADAKVVGDALLETKITPFTYEIGSELDRKSPYMANEKYGFQALADLSELSIAFKLYLNASCNVTHSIKDANGVVYGEVTQAYTISASGDSVDVDLTFSFTNPLPAGQYYFWLQSSVNSSMSYSYLNTSQTYPAYDYIKLTSDGGWNGTAGQTSVSSYGMCLTAIISGKVVGTKSKFDVLEEDISSLGTEVNDFVNNFTVNAKEADLNKSYEYSFKRWNKYTEDVFTANDDGFVMTANHNAGGETSLFSANNCIEYSPYFKIKFNASGTGLNSGVTCYLSYVGTDGNQKYKGVLINTDGGNKEVIVDLAYYQQYEYLGDTFSVIIACGSTSAWTMTISSFTAESVLTDDNVGDNVADYLGYLNTQINVVSSEVNTDKPIYLVSPNGDKYVLLVDSNGSITGTPIIPNKTLFIGNSLLIGHGTFGMCATDNQHDYYYHVTNEITLQNVNATFDKLSGTTFEGATNESTANTWMSETLLPHLASDLDLVVVQLGDNVNTTDKVTAFETNCKNLLSYIRTQCNNARVAWVGEWYSSATKQNIISQACASTGSVFIDISDLATNSNQASIGDVIHRTTSTTTSYAIDSYTDDAINKVLTIVFTVNNTQYTSELPYTSYTTATNTITVTGYYTIVTSAGTASHPSNTGMLAIANRICYKLGLIDEEGDIA